MKTWMLVAATVALPGAVYAQVTLPEITIMGSVPQPGRVPQAVPLDEAQRAELIKDIDAARAALLPETEAAQAFNARYSPRLTDLKNTATTSKTSVELSKVKKDFADWKAVVLKAQFAEKQKAAPGAETFAGFTERKAREIEFVSNLQQQFALQRAKAQTLQAEAVVTGSNGQPNAAGWNRVFDWSTAAPAAGNDGAVRAEPLTGEARFNKIRAIAVNDWKANPKIVDAAIAEAVRQNVDPALVLSVIWQESRFRTGATSPVGARGLMQIMPDTGRDLGVSNPDNLYDMKTNLRAGIKYLRNAAAYLKLNVDLSDISDAAPNKIKALLASYNAGIGAVSKWLRQQGQDLVRIPYAETRHYVSVIGSKIAGLGAALGW